MYGNISDQKFSEFRYSTIFDQNVPRRQVILPLFADGSEAKITLSYHMLIHSDYHTVCHSPISICMYQDCEEQSCTLLEVKRSKGNLFVLGWGVWRLRKHVISDISSPNLNEKVHKSYVWLTAPLVCYICISQLLLAPPPQIRKNPKKIPKQFLGFRERPCWLFRNITLVVSLF